MKTKHWFPLLVLAAASAGGASAQDAPRAPAPDALSVQSIDSPAQVGDATQRLFALQRGGSVASPTPRPIAGDVATLSYQRYLDSFKRPIPDHFTTTVRSAGAARPAQ